MNRFLNSKIDIASTLYSAAETRELDRIAIKKSDITGYELMCRASQSAFDLLRLRWPSAQHFSVFCGAGNNAGDGYVIARLLIEAGLSVNVISLVAPGKLAGDAKTAHENFNSAGGISVDIAQIDWKLLGRNTDVIIDAILGTGLTRPVTGEWAVTIELINSLQIPVLAVDMPSGLDTDTGSKQNTAINATATITFIANKKGLHTADASDCCGQLFFDGLQVPESVYECVSATTILIDKKTFSSARLQRKQASHKGTYGHVVIVGGNIGMFGAASLAAEAALRSGAGLVTALIRKDSAAAHHFRLAEIMCREIEAPGIDESLQQRASVIAIGPGLGQDDWAKEMLSIVIDSNKPLVLDADALNLLAEAPRHQDNWVLTPHPQEAARLLNCTVADIQHDRFSAAQSIANNYGGICVLKGNGSIIHNGRSSYLVSAGNPGMATAGAGDVLTGTTAALIGQLDNMFVAASYGAWVHARAGDNAVRNGMNGIVAGDIIAELQLLFP